MVTQRSNPVTLILSDLEQEEHKVSRRKKTKSGSLRDAQGKPETVEPAEILELAASQYS